MIIKPLEMDHIAACADILCAVYNNELWMCRWDKKTAMNYLRDFYDHKKFVGFTAWEEEKLIGALFAHEKIWWNNSEVFIEEMFVLPEKQGQGIGTLVLKEVEKYINEKHFAGITLSTNKYAPAPKFYEKNEFMQCEHVIFMAKDMVE